MLDYTIGHRYVRSTICLRRRQDFEAQYAVTRLGCACLVRELDSRTLDSQLVWIHAGCPRHILHVSGWLKQRAEQGLIESCTIESNAIIYKASLKAVRC